MFLSENSLRSLNNARDYLDNITLLNLSSSNIVGITERVMEVIIQNVKYLDIMGNNVTEIPRIITKANNLTELWISKNPYECHCDMLWMKNWLTNTSYVMDKDNVTCSNGMY